MAFILEVGSLANDGEDPVTQITLPTLELARDQANAEAKAVTAKTGERIAPWIHPDDDTWQLGGAHNRENPSYWMIRRA